MSKRVNVINQKLEQLWNWLTEPSMLVRKSEQKRQARLLVALFLLLIPIGIMRAALPLLIDPSYGNITDLVGVWIVLGVGVIIAIAYFMTRTCYYSVATVTLVVLSSLAIFGASIDVHWGDEIGLYYLILPTLLASFFFSIHLAWVVTLIDLVGLLVAPWFFPVLDWYAVYMGPLSFVAILSMVILLTTHYRDRVEKDRQAELALSEERFRTLANSAPVLIWMADTDGGYSFFNKRWLEFTGRQLEQKVGEGWIEQVHPDDREHCVQTYQAAFHARQPFVVEYRLRRADGVYRWVLNTGTPRFLPNHEFAGYIGSAMDVTEQRQARDALQHRLAWEKLVSTISTALVNLTSGSMTDSITQVLEMLGTFVRADRSYVFQISDDGTTLNNVYEWCAPGITSQKQNAPHVPMTAMAWIMEKLNRLEIVHLARVTDLPPDAHAEQALLQARATRSMIAVPLVYQNRLQGFLGLDAVRQEMQWMEEDIKLLNTVGEMLVNTFARQRSEEALRQSEERWRMYIEGANDLIFALDAAGKITMANRAMCNTLGYSLAELLGTSPVELVVPEQRAFAAELLARIFKGENIDLLELNALRKDGRRVVMEVRGRAFTQAQKVVSTLHIARDVTERRQAALRLEYLSTHDALTDLYNRLFFEEELKRLEHSRYFPVSIVMCDVNGLKATNDQYGHAAGDDLLRRTARVLRAAFRAEDVIARIGGDEFAVLLPNTEAAVAHKLLARVREYLARHNQTATPALGLALGVATGEQSGTLLRVLHDADVAMYRDKHGE